MHIVNQSCGNRHCPMCQYQKSQKWLQKQSERMLDGHYFMLTFTIPEAYRPIPEIDHWLRRRLRMCYIKRWRWCRTKVRELVKLGTNLRLSISIGLSRKGPWRLAKTLATQSGMTNKWLKDQGLISVKDLWVNIHYPATAR